MIRVVHEFGGATKCRSFRNGVNHAVNGVLIMNVMQVCSVALSMLINQKNLVVRVEMDNVILGVETRSKTRANMITNHYRITHMQVSHRGERWFRAACTSLSNVQSGKGPCTLQGFQGDVARISTKMTSLDTKQFVKGCDWVTSSEQEERTVQRVLVGHEVVRSHRVGQDLVPFKWTVLEPFPSTIFQETMSGFELSIPLRVVGTGKDVIEV